MAMLSAQTVIDVKYHHAKPTSSLQQTWGAVKQAFTGDAARTASPEEWVAACAAMLSALTALTSKGVLELEPGIVKEAVAGRAAREVAAVGLLLLASAADGRPKTAEQVLFHRAFENL